MNARRMTTVAGDLESLALIAKMDEACCRLLANKVILSRILKAVAEEYEDCSVEEIEQLYLDGPPQVRTAAVDQDAGRVVELNTADKSAAEGKIFYDILFSAKVPGSSETRQILINLENQNQWNPGYPLLKRSVYYCARLLSGQKGTVFTGDNYGGLQKVYSIWICTRPVKEKENTINLFTLSQNALVGNQKYDKIEYDMMTIALLCLGEPEKAQSGILKLLSVLLADGVGAEQKKKILEKEFQIPMTVEMKKEAAAMCTIGESIYQRARDAGLRDGHAEGEAKGLAKGLAKGKVQGEEKEKKQTILGMLKEKLPVDMIARVTRASVEQITELGKLNGLL